MDSLHTALESEGFHSSLWWVNPRWVYPGCYHCELSWDFRNLKNSRALLLCAHSCTGPLWDSCRCLGTFVFLKKNNNLDALCCLEWPAQSRTKGSCETARSVLLMHLFPPMLGLNHRFSDHSLSTRLHDPPQLDISRQNRRVYEALLHNHFKPFIVNF